MSSDLFDRQKDAVGKGERTILVYIELTTGKQIPNSLDEFKQLAESSGLDIIDTVQVKLSFTKAQFFIGTGKVDELAVSDEEMDIPYVVGESVKVVDGPFNNFNGVIENINEEKKKLTVMVKIFGRKTPLELNYMQVEKDG